MDKYIVSFYYNIFNQNKCRRGSRLDEALRNLRNKLESKNVNVEIKSTCTLVQKSIELYEALEGIAQMEEDYRPFCNSATSALETVDNSLKSYEKMHDENRETLEKALKSYDINALKSIFESKRIPQDIYNDVVQNYLNEVCRTGDLKAITFLRIKGYELWHGPVISWSDFAERIMEALFIAIESNQIFIVSYLLFRTCKGPNRYDLRQQYNSFERSFLVRDPNNRPSEGNLHDYYFKRAYAYAFKFKKREILKLFAPAKDGRDYAFYLACLEYMTAEEFIETEKELEMPPWINEINALKNEVSQLKRKFEEFSINSASI